MREIFADILRQTQNNQTAEWQMEIDGETYTRLFRPKERLILLGAGHIAQPLCEIASMLGFAVIVVDDRPLFANHPRFPQAERIVCGAFPHAIERLQIHAGDHVAVITRGHRYDADCLRTLLAGTMPRYLGMLRFRAAHECTAAHAGAGRLCTGQAGQHPYADWLGYWRAVRAGNRGVHCGAIGADAQARTESPLQITYPDGGDILCGCRGGHCQQSAQKSAAAGV